MGQGVHTVALQVAVEELGVDPDRIEVDRRHHPRARRRPDDREPGHADGRRRGADGVRGGAAPAGARPGVDYQGEYRVDWTHHLGEGVEQPDHPLRVRLRRPARGASTARRAPSSRWSAAHDVGRAVNPLLCEGQIEGAVHMGLGYALTEDFPSDDDGLPDQHDAARASASCGPRTCRRSRSILVEAPQPDVAVRHQGRRRDRPRPHGRRRGRRAARRRRPVAAPRCRCGAARRRRWTRATRHHPGLVCGHHHLYSALARGMPAPPRPPHDFLEILEQVWWRLDAALDLEMLRWSAHARRARGAGERHDRDRRPPREPRTPSRAASTSSPTPAPRSACGCRAATA